MKYRPTNKLNRSFKERTIIADLISVCPDLIINKKIEGGSSKRRPDIFIDMKEYCIIVEIDERQHRSYQYLKDAEDRVKDLQKDVNTRPLVLIRFNPDKYKSKGKKYRSVFSKTRGTRLYKIGCPKKYDQRMMTLIKLLSFYLTNGPKTQFVEHKLYFDGFVEEFINTIIETKIE